MVLEIDDKLFLERISEELDKFLSQDFSEEGLPQTERERDEFFEKQRNLKKMLLERFSENYEAAKKEVLSGKTSEEV